MNSVEAIYSIPNCSVSIFATDANGNAVAPAIWSASCVEQVEVRDTAIIDYSRPTGATYEVPHQINEGHQLNITGLQDFTFGQNRNTTFVIYIAWTQANGIPGRSGNLFRDRSYFGCMEVTDGVVGRGVNGADGNVETRSFSAQFFVSNNGAVPPPGPASSTQA